MEKRILAVEDEEPIREILRAFLEDAGYAVTTAGDGMEGLDRFNGGAFDLVILDILMPRVDGYTLCEMIRKTSDVPVIMLTALDDEADELRGFDLKVDDYITKPFSPGILLRRVEAVLRRGLGEGARSTLDYGPVTMDLEGHRVFVDGAEVPLTNREYEILRLLLVSRGRVVTRANLLSQVWDYDFFGDEKIVNTHIKNIRKKLGMDFIETIRGVGYRID